MRTFGHAKFTLATAVLGATFFLGACTQSSDCWPSEQEVQVKLLTELFAAEGAELGFDTFEQFVQSQPELIGMEFGKGAPHSTALKATLLIEQHQVEGDETTYRRVDVQKTGCEEQATFQLSEISSEDARALLKTKQSYSITPIGSRCTPAARVADEALTDSALAEAYKWFGSGAGFKTEEAFRREAKILEVLPLDNFDGVPAKTVGIFIPVVDENQRYGRPFKGIIISDYCGNYFDHTRLDLDADEIAMLEIGDTK